MIIFVVFTFTSALKSLNLRTYSKLNQFNNNTTYTIHSTTYTKMGKDNVVLVGTRLPSLTQRSVVLRWRHVADDSSPYIILEIASGI